MNPVRSLPVGDAVDLRLAKGSAVSEYGEDWLVARPGRVLKLSGRRPAISELMRQLVDGQSISPAGLAPLQGRLVASLVENDFLVKDTTPQPWVTGIYIATSGPLSAQLSERAGSISRAAPGPQTISIAVLESSIEVLRAEVRPLVASGVTHAWVAPSFSGRALCSPVWTSHHGSACLDCFIIWRARGLPSVAAIDLEVKAEAAAEAPPAVATEYVASWVDRLVSHGPDVDDLRRIRVFDTATLGTGSHRVSPLSSCPTCGLLADRSERTA